MGFWETEISDSEMAFRVLWGATKWSTGNHNSKWWWWGLLGWTEEIMRDSRKWSWKTVMDSTSAFPPLWSDPHRGKGRHTWHLDWRLITNELRCVIGGGQCFLSEEIKSSLRKSVFVFEIKVKTVRKINLEGRVQECLSIWGGAKEGVKMRGAGEVFQPSKLAVHTVHYLFYICHFFLFFVPLIAQHISSTNHLSLNCYFRLKHSIITKLTMLMNFIF